MLFKSKNSYILSVLIILSVSVVGYFKTEEKGCFYSNGLTQANGDFIDKDTLNILILGDQGSGSPKQLAVASAIKKLCNQSQCDLALLLGDNFYENGVKSVSDEQWETKFESVYKGLNLPFYAVLGNHDVKGNYKAQINYNKAGTNWNMPDVNYHINSKIANFFAINTECPVDSYIWLRNQFNKLTSDSDSKWNFVFGHRSIFSTGTHGDLDYIGRELSVNLMQSADFYLAGHNHLLEHLTHKDTATQFIVSGSAGKKYDLQQNQNRKLDTVANNLFSSIDLGFVYLKLSSSQADFTFYNKDLKQLYNFVKDKNQIERGRKLHY